MGGEDNDSVTLRLPTKYLAGVLVVGIGLGGGAAGFVGPSLDGRILQELQSQIRKTGDKADEALKAALRAEALGQASLDLGTQNAKQINHNRDFITERTFDRFSKEQQLEHTRQQSERDLQQDRRLDGIERDMDRE